MFEAEHTLIRIYHEADKDLSMWERLNPSDIQDELLRNEIPVEATEIMFKQGKNFTDAQISQIFVD